VNRLSAITLVLGLLCAGVQADTALPSIAIIIDDIGYQHQHDSAALALPGPLTFSVLPHTPGVKHALKEAKARGNEIMLHLPMEPHGHQHSKAPGTLMMNMDRVAFVHSLQSSLASVPGAIAVNNHEGSRLTSDSLKMQWLMQELSRHRHMTFIDSRTTDKTVALQTAIQYGLTATRRDVFLDYKPGQIATQFEKLIKLAKKKGTALGIAHPYPETVRFLDQQLPGLEKQGVRLVKLSHMMQLQRKRIARY